MITRRRALRRRPRPVAYRVPATVVALGRTERLDHHALQPAERRIVELAREHLMSVRVRGRDDYVDSVWAGVLRLRRVPDWPNAEEPRRERPEFLGRFVDELARGLSPSAAVNGASENHCVSALEAVDLRRVAELVGDRLGDLSGAPVLAGDYDVDGHPRPRPTGAAADGAVVPRTSSKRSTYWARCRAPRKASRTRSRALWPIHSARSGSRSSARRLRRTARGRSAAPARRSRRPRSDPGSRRPADATTGRAFHIASATVRPNPSAMLFCTTMSARR